MSREEAGGDLAEAMRAFDRIEDELNRLLLTVLGSDDWGYVDGLLEERGAALARYQAAVAALFEAKEMRGYNAGSYAGRCLRCLGGVVSLLWYPWRRSLS